MKPLFNTRNAGDIFLQLMKIPPRESYKQIVHNNWISWQSEISPINDQNALMDSINESIRKSHLKRKTSENIPKIAQPEIRVNENSASASKDLVLNIIPSLFFYDGRLSNRPWLQEIPDPVTGIVWQSWLDMNAETARTLNIREGEMVRVISASGKCEIPVRLTDKISEYAVSLQTGQGHWAMGETADKIGVNAFSLIDQSILLPTTVKIEKTGNIEIPLYLNNRGDQFNRDLLKTTPVDQKLPKENLIMPLPEGYRKEHDLYRPHEHKEHRWAMVIDLQSCIGCKACEAACYAENNVPTVGRSNCYKGLEMSWLKVVTYKVENEKAAFLPLPCQHCDAAPCEPVCPVYASAHTEEGLNAQIYNRCVGTRYCSNNCPYKVRRFNWKNIHHNDIDRLQLNPEVTVRCRGVMEKCTFCVQRIRYVEYAAKREERKIKDGEIIPACAQTCPTNAIIFGDLLDEHSTISQLFNHDRRYQLLQELNTKPAVVYLKKIIL
jgi:molybdopterin-containing oxidoreductase family iron-sulfur binding subunit